MAGEADRVDANSIYALYTDACLQAKETAIAQGQFTRELKKRSYETRLNHGSNVFVKLQARRITTAI